MVVIGDIASLAMSSRRSVLYRCPHEEPPAIDAPRRQCAGAKSFACEVMSIQLNPRLAANVTPRSVGVK
jgi:hypothetical protein